MTSELDKIIKKSLTEFSEHVRTSGWRGREREAVSYYVTGFLSKHVMQGTSFYDFSQAVIEGAVAQISDSGKKHCNKDLLIWSKPGMTCWNDTWELVEVPLAILEWKVHRPKINPFKEFNEHDLDWLSMFTAKNSGTIGITVALDIAAKPSVLYGALCTEGKHDLQWLKC